MSNENEIAEAIRYTLESPNEADKNWENANVVDGLFFIGRCINNLAKGVNDLVTLLNESGIISQEPSQGNGENEYMPRFPAERL